MKRLTKARTTNMGFASGGLTCKPEVLCSEIRHLRQAAKRQAVKKPAL